jgi:hypothetical protein
MEFPAVGEPKDTRKLTPTSSRRCPKLVKGAVTNPSFWIHLSSIKSSIRTIPATVAGITDKRYWKAIAVLQITLWFNVLPNLLNMLFFHVHCVIRCNCR